MTTNVRTVSAGRRANVSRTQRTQNAFEVKAYLEALRPYSGLLFAVLMILLLVTFKGKLIALVDHQIESVSVHGSLNQVSAQDVSSKISPWLQSSFLTADLVEIKTQVDSLPWVLDSTV